MKTSAIVGCLLLCVTSLASSVASQSNNNGEKEASDPQVSTLGSNYGEFDDPEVPTTSNPNYGEFDDPEIPTTSASSTSDPSPTSLEHLDGKQTIEDGICTQSHCLNNLLFSFVICTIILVIVIGALFFFKKKVSLGSPNQCWLGN